MAKIKVTSKCELYDGMSITFKAPCDCTAVDGLNVYHADVSQTFSFTDAHGNNLAGTANLFSEGAYIKAVLNTTDGHAYLQNADTNSYLEEKLETLANSLIVGSSNPTEATAGTIGQKYYNESSGSFFICVAVSGSRYIWMPVGTSKGAEFGTRGPILITESQNLDLTAYGLKVGDKVNVICIGGGGGGGGGYAAGGAAGKGGASSTWCGGGGGGGAGYGAGGGGGGGTYGKNESVGSGGGGGGGYLQSATVTLTSTTVSVTIGAGGSGGAAGSTSVSAGSGTKGGTTSFGSLLSANGGAGGIGWTYSTSAFGTVTSSPGKGGVGGTTGGNGVTGSRDGTSASGTYYDPGGGGGGGGWYVENFLVHTSSNGSTPSIMVNETTQLISNISKGGNGGGVNGGLGGASGTSGSAAGDCTGHGAVVLWY